MVGRSSIHAVWRRLVGRVVPRRVTSGRWQSRSSVSGGTTSTYSGSTPLADISSISAAAFGAGETGSRARSRRWPPPARPRAASRRGSAPRRPRTRRSVEAHAAVEREHRQDVVLEAQRVPIEVDRRRRREAQQRQRRIGVLVHVPRALRDAAGRVAPCATPNTRHCRSSASRAPESARASSGRRGDAARRGSSSACSARPAQWHCRRRRTRPAARAAVRTARACRSARRAGCCSWRGL